MRISPAQCRAARAMLGWSQDELAINAQVARASIADFEREVRVPIRTNLVSILSALTAAGIEFIPDSPDKTKGAGVRFRKVELEFDSQVRLNTDSIVVSVRYAGTPLRILVPEEIIDDVGGRMGPSANPTQKQRIQIVQDHLPLFLCAAENLIKQRERTAEETIVLIHESFPAGTFG